MHELEARRGSEDEGRLLRPAGCDFDSCDLGALVEDVVEELSATHGDRFESVIDEGVRGVWSYDELRRALWNLGVNAVKYGDPKRRVSIHVERTRSGARLSVHNYGKPIPHEDQATIFDHYSRLKSAGRPGAGWGLGLALVRACADAHGGSVDVDSSEEAGTTFSLVLAHDSRPFQQQARGGASSGAGDGTQLVLGLEGELGPYWE